MNIAFYWGNIPYAQYGGIDRVTIVLAEAFQRMQMNIYCIYSGGVKILYLRALVACSCGRSLKKVMFR